jgi:hypothetical protein
MARTLKIEVGLNMNLAFLLFTTFIAVTFFAGSLVLMNCGYRHGARYLAQSGDPALTGLGSIEAAVFALVGLLLAFAISGALQRFDERRQLILTEGNAISTVYDRLDLLDNPRKLALKSKVKDYFGARIALYHEGINFSLWQGAEVASPLYTARISKLKSEIWNEAVAACAATEVKIICAMILPPLNEMFAAARSRDGANGRHPPRAIYITLFVLGLGSSFLAGVAMAASKRKSWVHVIAFAAAVGIALFVVTDVEYPRLGIVRVNQLDQQLVDLYHKM